MSIIGFKLNWERKELSKC